MHMYLILDNFEDALDWQKNRRPFIAPALYNKKRLFEQPIPIIEPNAHAIEMEAENVPAVLVPVIAEVFGGISDYEDDSLTEYDQDNLYVDEVKIEPNLFRMNDADQQALDGFLNELEDQQDVEENEDESDDEFVFADLLGNVVDNLNLPGPIDCNVDGLVKRENDKMSGAIPFRESVYSLLFFIQTHILRKTKLF